MHEMWYVRNIRSFSISYTVLFPVALDVARSQPDSVGTRGPQSPVSCTHCASASPLRLLVKHVLAAIPPGESIGNLTTGGLGEPCP